MAKAKAKATPKARATKSGTGVVSQLLTQFEKGIVSKVIWGVNWVLQQIFLEVSALLLPGMLSSRTFGSWTWTPTTSRSTWE